MPRSIRILGVEGLPEIQPGDELCDLIGAAVRGMRDYPPDGSIFVVAQKIVSKAEGRVVPIAGVTPSPEAVRWAAELQKDARLVEVILGDSKRVVRAGHGVLITETHHGFICANAGVDSSNAPKGTVILLPEDPDASARRLREGLRKALGIELGVIISDTFGRPWRQGLTNVALGVAGLSPFVDYRGQRDCYGRTMTATVLAVADELAAAAELVMGKTDRIPVAVIAGVRYCAGEGWGRQLIRPSGDDLFR